MSRLSIINQVLIDVIVHFTEASISSAAKSGSDKSDTATAASSTSMEAIVSGSNPAEIYIKLESLIEKSTDISPSDHAILLDLLNLIIALEIFLKPVKKQAAAEGSPRPLHELLIRGQKIPTSAELQQQLIALIEPDFILVENEEAQPEEQHLTTERPRLGALLQERVYAALSITAQTADDEVRALLATIFREHELELLAEKARLEHRLTDLTAENSRLREENVRLTQAVPQRRENPGYPWFGFAAQVARVVGEILFEDDRRTNQPRRF